MAAYTQYARGYLAPPLSAQYVANPELSDVVPERSTNYQAGIVYHGASLSIDADVYKIDFSNKFASFVSPVQNEGTVFTNLGAVHLQVANAPEYTAADGVLYKHGPIFFLLIDKYIGQQWFAEGEPAAYRSKGYNTAILSARYDIGPVRIGAEVNNLFDSQPVTNVNVGKSAAFDQYLYQTGRQFTGDVTLMF